MTDISTLPLLANASVADDDWTLIYDTSDGLLKRVRKDGLTAEQAADIDMISQWGGGNKTVEDNLTVGSNFRANGTSRLVGNVTADGDVDVSGDVDATDITASGNGQIDGNLTLAGDLTLTDKTQIQADWDETTSTEVGYIKNRPTVPGTILAGRVTFTGTNTIGAHTQFVGTGVTASIVNTDNLRLTHNVGSLNYAVFATLLSSSTSNPHSLYFLDKTNSAIDISVQSRTADQSFMNGNEVMYMIMAA